MSNNKQKINNFWNLFCNSLPKDEQDICIDTKFEAWSFGDNPQMADDLLGYVLTGEKTATSGMLLDYENDNDPVPNIGDRAIILNGINEPICIIEYIDVQKKKFNEVEEEFALKEAEGFKSLKDWRDLHWEFFTRRCKVLGIPIHEEIMLVCMEFKMIFK